MSSDAINSMIIQYLIKAKVPSGEEIFYCQSRDESSARLSSWLNYFSKIGFSKPNLFIVGAIIGELTNNAFDHNLAQWRGLPGCVVAFVKQNSSLQIHIADAGQGIVSSLKNSLPDLQPQEIINQAFEKRISGRHPERRGNGLKFVSGHIIKSDNSLKCYSQGVSYQIGKPTFDSGFGAQLPKDFGTYILINWRIL
jgi:hypothetical protein